MTACIAFLGFADASYLAADHFLALPVPCSITGGCETVLKSDYATIGPVPIALLGALYYLLALFLAVSIYTSSRPSPRTALVIFGLSGIGVLASAYLMYLQAFVLRAFCQYCIGSALSSLLLCIASGVLWWQMSRKFPAAAAAKA